MQLRNRRLLTVCALIVVIVGGAVVALSASHKKPSSPNLNQHVDPFSHEVVSSPAGKTPEAYGTNKNLPVYLGFDKLLDNGLSFDQLTRVESAFYDYSKSLPKPSKQISVDVDHINVQHDPTNPNSPFAILFKVQFDAGTIYQARVEYASLNDVRLYLVDPASNKTVYDSGVLSS